MPDERGGGGACSLPMTHFFTLPSSSVSSAVVERETFVEPAVAVVIVEREHEFVSVAERP